MTLTVVLVRPEIPQNVGFVARTMKCFNLDRLTIVGRPRYRPNSLAYKTGFTASETLRKAAHVKTLSEALKDTHLALGFTRRDREKTSERTWDLLEVAPCLDFNQNIALVYGQESQGLFKEDCALMTQLVKIELPNRNLSLNLSHAVTITLHALYSQSMLTGNSLHGKGGAVQVGRTPHRTQPPSANTGPQPTPQTPAGQVRTDKLPTGDRLENQVETQPATFQDREETFDFLIHLLRKKQFFRRKKDAAKADHLRNLWQRANPDAKELDFIAGMLQKLKG